MHLVVVGGGKYVGAVHQLIALDDDDGGALDLWQHQVSGAQM